MKNTLLNLLHKSLILLSLTFTILCFSGLKSDVFAYDFEAYSMNGEYYLDYEDYYEEYVHIPSYYSGYKITLINAYTFSYCDNLKGVTIPETVKTIKSYSFYSCDNLTSVAIPESVTTIEDNAFYNITNLTIYGVPGSAAYNFAISNGYTFKDISELHGKIQFENAKSDYLTYEDIEINYTSTEIDITQISLSINSDDYYLVDSNTIYFASPGKASIIAYYGMYSAEYIITAKPLSPSSLTVSGVDDDYYDEHYIYIEWDYINSYSIDGFNIYRATSSNGPYTLIGTTDPYTTYYYDENVPHGIKFYYKIEAYANLGNETITSNGAFSPSVCLAIDKPTISYIKSTKSNTIQIKWANVNHASGYYIYRNEQSDGTYKLIKTITASATQGTKISYTDKNLPLGKTYYYKICAFVNFNNTKTPVSYSKVKSELVRISTTKITKSVSKKKSTNTLTWKKVSDADGYIIYYSKKSKGTYKKLKTIKGRNKLSYTHKKLKNGTAYYYKVVAYKKLNGNNLLSNPSVIHQKYCDYFSYAGESYESRYKRIFGKRKAGYYTSASQAAKNMTTIKIKVWDINSKGKKYTRTFSLTVHKNIAPSVKQMFKEIYKSKEKFPIHDIGAYSWRTNNPNSEHCIGLAIDINANENYMIDNGVILAGSFWNPKKSKYSIPLNCKLVKILNKYGFTRGFWGNRKDYMHFSYMGT